MSSGHIAEKPNNVFSSRAKMFSCAALTLLSAQSLQAQTIEMPIAVISEVGLPNLAIVQCGLRNLYQQKEAVIIT
jgi:hypothetical protein